MTIDFMAAVLGHTVLNSIISAILLTMDYTIRTEGWYLYQQSPTTRREYSVIIERSIDVVPCQGVERCWYQGIQCWLTSQVWVISYLKSIQIDYGTGRLYRISTRWVILSGHWSISTLKEILYWGRDWGRDRGRDKRIVSSSLSIW